LFTPFIASIYALENNNNPIDVAFEALKQILADSIYSRWENELTPVLQEGLKQYRTGGTAWTNFKEEYFSIIDKTIIINNR